MSGELAYPATCWSDSENRNPPKRPVGIVAQGPNEVFGFTLPGSERGLDVEAAGEGPRRA